MIRTAALIALFLIAAGARAAEPCARVAEIKSKSRQIFESKALMPQLMVLQGQGEAKFHPTFAPPRSQCSFEKFEVAGNTVDALHTPFEKLGDPTLLWQFVTAGAEPRTIHVIHDPVTSLMNKKDVFFVLEERQGKISHYAIYRDQPTFASLKPLVTGILDGSLQPLSVVHWPAGAKEPEIDSFDKRLN
jgi:hypothetical protein